MGIPQNSPGNQPPPRRPRTKNAMTVKTRTWRITKSRPAMYLVKKSRRRLIGFERNRSMLPKAMKSGKMEAVEIKARTAANHVRHRPITKALELDLWRGRGGMRTLGNVMPKAEWWAESVRHSAK